MVHGPVGPLLDYSNETFKNMSSNRYNPCHISGRRSFNESECVLCTLGYSESFGPGISYSEIQRKLKSSEVSKLRNYSEVSSCLR